MISWFLLVPVLVPVLVFLLSFVRKMVLFHLNFLVSPRSGTGSGAVPSSPFFSFSQENGVVPPRLHGSVSTQASCVPFSISSLTNEFWNEQWMKVSKNWNDQWILNCTWPSSKHGLVLFGVYAGVIFLMPADTQIAPARDPKHCGGSRKSMYQIQATELWKGNRWVRHDRNCSSRTLCRSR